MLDPLTRWRLLLGDAADGALGAAKGAAGAMDDALSWLYGREQDGAAEDDRNVVDRRGGSGASAMTVPDWINQVHKLFPQETIERLEKDAVERYEIADVVTNPEVLSRIEPNETLLRAVLRTKHLMNPQVLELARELVRKVVEQLLEQLKSEVQVAFAGIVDRRRRSPLQVAKNFDFKSTLRKNLKRYDPDTKQIVLEQPQFFSRVRRFTEQWQVILVVDQSGSMVGSVIHSAVTAACLWNVPGLKPHLVVFDTSVVDLTNDVVDPVETLMKVQLGGGTDIHSAVKYAAQLVEAPRRAIVVLITDFFEGGDEGGLVREVAGLVSQGSIVLGLAALDPEAVPQYDRDLARRIVDVGASVGAMTPGELAGFVADAVRGKRSAP
ncbi:MAG TPA: VWA domain-containing protein [Myxococcota bacterium]